MTIYTYRYISDMTFCFYKCQYGIFFIKKEEQKIGKRKETS